MTSERDFDRLVGAWLALSPDEAPDRVVAAVLQAAEVTPQARRPLRRPFWRHSHMTRLPIVATVVATLAVIVGGGMLFLRNDEPGIGGPTAAPSPTSAPSPSPSVSTSAGAIPDDLRFHWIGEPRDIPGSGTSTRTAIDFTSGGFFADGSSYPDGLFGSTATLVSPDEVELVTGSTRGGCETGDIGRYRYTLSPGGTRLSMIAVSDDCAARSIATVGEWFRVACKSVENACWGDLEAGTYPTQYIRPHIGTGEAWEPLLGDMTFTVPDGWANSADWPLWLALTPSADYALETRDGPRPDAWHQITVLPQVAATAQNADCSPVEQTDVPRTVEGLMDFTTSLPSVSAGKPQPITIDGYSGQWVDLRLAADWTGTCPGLTTPEAMIAMRTGATTDSELLGIFGEERQRFIYLDIGDGDIVLIAIGSADPARYDALIAEAMPIVESFDFK